jgi:hypothetical protein
MWIIYCMNLEHFSQFICLTKVYHCIIIIIISVIIFISATLQQLSIRPTDLPLRIHQRRPTWHVQYSSAGSWIPSNYYVAGGLVSENSLPWGCVCTVPTGTVIGKLTVVLRLCLCGSFRFKVEVNKWRAVRRHIHSYRPTVLFKKTEHRRPIVHAVTEELSLGISLNRCTYIEITRCAPFRNFQTRLSRKCRM